MEYDTYRFAKRRNELMEEVKAYMDRIYPEDIFVSPFSRDMCACVAACFMAERELGSPPGFPVDHDPETGKEV